MTSLYFFSAGDRIKIGISKNVSRRRGDVSRTSGLVVTTLGAIPGSYALERFVHEKLASHRLEGEWFSDCLDVRRVIRGLQESGPISIGFVEPPARERPATENRERTPEEWVRTDHKLLELIWSGDGYEQFAAFVEVPIDQVRRWFRGEEKWPRVYRFAFAGLVGMACMGSPIPSYIEENKTAVA